MWRVGTASAVLLMILIAGCISQELTIEERLACTDLASRSHALIPKCNSQAACFDKVEKELFNFPTSGISSKSQQQLYYYKNHTALSWLYFNKAIANLEKIYSICSSSSNHYLLPQNINELSFNLKRAFEESDSAHQKSFEILLLEEIDFHNSDINKMKEETLYTDYIKINQNLNELQTLEKENSDTYVSFYHAQAQKFDSLVQTAGFKGITVKEFSAFDLLGPYSSLVFKQIPKKNFNIPVLTGAVTSLINGLNNALKVRNAVAVLQTFPSFEFVQSYNDFMGTKNSVAMKFAGFLRDISVHKQEIIKRNTQFESEITAEIADIRKKTDLLSAEEYSFDENFFSEIYAFLGQESSIATQRYNIISFSNLQQQTSQALAGIETEFNDLKQKGFLGALSLGEKTQKLKEIKNTLSELNSNVDYLTEETISGLEVLCETRISQIEKNLKETQIPGDLVLKVVDLKSRTNFKIKRFKSESNKKEKLLYCKSAIEEYNSFSSALKDFEQHSLEVQVRLEECINFLDYVFSHPLETSLDDFSFRYHALKSIPQPYSNIDYVKKSCSLLSADIETHLSGIGSIKEINSLFADSKSSLETLRTMAKLSPATVSGKTLGVLEERFSALEKFFTGNSLNLRKSLSFLKEIRQNISEFHKNLKQQLKDAIVSYLKENAVIESFSEEVPETNTEFSSKLKITFRNPFPALRESVLFTIPLHRQLSELTGKTENVLEAKMQPKGLQISLSSVPTGFTVLEFISLSLVETEEEFEFISVNSTSALVRKQITLKTESQIPKLKVSVALASPASLKTANIFVYTNDLQISYWGVGTEIHFFVENAKPNQKIQIYYSILNPISISITLKSTQRLDQNTFLYQYEIKLKNNLPYKMSKIPLVLPLNLNETFTESIELRASNNSKLKFSTLPNGNIALTFPELYPGTQGILHLTQTVHNAEDYWLGEMQKLKNKLNELSKSHNKEIRSKTSVLLQQLNTLGQKSITKKETLNIFTKLLQDTLILEQQASQFSDFSAQYLSLKSSISSEISQFKAEIEQARKYNFSEHASKLAEMIANAEERLKEAEISYISNEYQPAMDSLFRAKSIISEHIHSSVPQQISLQRENLMSQLEALFSTAEELQLTPEIQQIKNLIYEFDAGVERNLSAQNIIEAKNSLDSMQNEADALNLKLLLISKEKSEKIKERISEFLRLTSKTSSENLDSLNSFFENVSESDLIKAHYVPPITKTRLQKLELKLDSLSMYPLDEKTREFLQFYGDGNYLSALKEAQSFDSKLITMLEEARLIDSELTSVIDLIKEDAATSFNSSVALFQESSFNRQAQDALEIAESAIDNEQYLNSIVSSRNASGLLSLAKASYKFDIPFSVYPIIIAVALLLLIRRKKEKDLKSKNLRIQKVIRNWE